MVSFNRFNKTINISNKLIKNNKSIEGTLIHEIQHAIQNIEGFERGKSSKGSKLAYYNSLGEIEATNTKERFIKEKYKNVDISNIAPESSKSHPKHNGLNNYLKNRNIVDKIKDSIYNYNNSNHGGNSNEINQEIILDNTEQNNSLVVGRERLNNDIENTANSKKSSFSTQDNKVKDKKTDNQDIKYSKNNKDWQSYLEDNFESKGTKTYFDEIRNSEKSSINLSEKVNKQDIANNQEQEYNNINTSTKEDINNDIQRTILKNDSKEENQRDGQFTTRENRRNQEEYRTIKQGIAEEQINKIQ